MTVILQNSGLSGWSDGSWGDIAMATLADGTYLVIGNRNGSIVAQHFGADGDFLGDQFTIEAPTSNNDSAPAVTALADGGFIVTWTAGSSDPDFSSAILSQRFDSTCARVGTTAKVNTTTAGAQYDSGVTGLDGGGYVVTWTSNGQDGSGASIYSRLYDASGQPASGEVRVNTYTTGNQTGAFVTRLASGGYIVTWTSDGQDGAGTGVYAQTYDALGHAVGSETRINTTVDGNQAVSSITSLQDGGYIIAWTSDASARYQRYDLHGAAVGSETLIYSGGLPGAAMPVVRGLSDGGFAIKWQVSAYNGFQTTYSLHTQRFDSTGDKIGGEGETDDEAHSPASFDMTALPGGGLASDWTVGLPTIFQSVTIASDGTDSGYHTIYGTGGNDTITGTPGTDGINGGSGDDHLTAVDLAGDLGNAQSGDALRGDGGNDTLTGGSLNNTLDGGIGADVMSGGAGNDSYYVDNAGDIVNEAAGDGNDYLYTGISYVLTAGSALENIILEGTGNIDATGNDQDNSLIGNDGNNLLLGGGGADYLAGGKGVDILDGGSGLDMFAYEATGNAGILFEMTGFDTATGVTLANGTIVRNVEAVSFSGGNGNDTVNGGVGADFISSSGGHDLLNGGAGNDGFYLATYDSETAVIDGGDGVDLVSFFNLDNGNIILDATLAATATGVTLFTGDVLRNVERFHITCTGSGNDSFLGGSGSDTFEGGNGTDSLNGGAGDDLLAVDGQGDTVDGGAGTDRLDLRLAFSVSGAITAGADGNGNYLIQSSGQPAWQATSIELVTLRTGNGNDTVSGMAGDDVLDGGNGNDRIDGGLGNDNLKGDFGSDILIGGAGNDTMYGWLDNDTYVVDDAGDVVTENTDEGTDTVQASITYSLGAGVENLALTGNAAINGTGNAAANSLTGNAAANTLTGLAGNDRLDGAAGADTMTGGLGDDTYIVDNAGDLVTELAAEGTDTVQAAVTATLSANLENLTLTGNAAINGTGNASANTLTGNAATNTLTGLAGNDVLDGGLGNDSLIGGAGNDTYIVDASADIATELAGEGTDVVQSSARFTLGNNIERLTLTGTANIAGTGNALNNVITGNSGNNRIDGGLGADSMSGAGGDDAYVIDDAGDRVFESANEGNDSVSAGFSYNLGSQYIENLTLTGTANLTATGNALANTLIGNSGNNVLNGNSGADKLYGGAGNDSYYVDNVADRTYETTASLADAGGHDVVYASVRLTLDQYVEDLVITGTASLAGTGNALDNSLTGNSGSNALLGKDGNDMLDGGAGADTMAGGLGNDTYLIDNALDRVAELNNQGYDTVYSSVSFALGNQFIETLTLTGSNAINATGNGIANYLSGNDSANSLDGGRGNDTLQGRGGADVFVFGLLSGADTITDFSAAQSDSINLHAYAHGVVNGGGIVIAQVAADTVITLGGGNIVTLTGASVVDVANHIVW